MLECPGALKWEGGEGAERRWGKMLEMCNEPLMPSLAPSQHIWELDEPIKPTPIKSASITSRKAGVGPRQTPPLGRMSELA